MGLTLDATPSFDEVEALHRRGARALHETARRASPTPTCATVRTAVLVARLGRGVVPRARVPAGRRRASTPSTCGSRCATWPTLEAAVSASVTAALSTASAAGPAVDERSTVLPSRTAVAPAAVERLELVRRDAALGADDERARHRRRAARRRPAAWSASSCSTSGGRRAAHQRGDVARSRPSARRTGHRARRDCLAAATSTASHLRRAFSPRSPRQTARRCATACHGTTSSTPTRWPPRPPARRGRPSPAPARARSAARGSGSSATEHRPAGRAVPAPTAHDLALDPQARAVGEQHVLARRRVRRTVAACRPSAPSSTHDVADAAARQRPRRRGGTAAGVTGGSLAVEGVAQLAEDEPCRPGRRAGPRGAPRRAARRAGAAAPPARRRAGSGSAPSTCTTRSPRPVPRRWVTPSPRSVIDVAGLGAGPDRRGRAAPSKVSSVRVVPSAAAVIGTSTVAVQVVAAARGTSRGGRRAIST